MHVLQMIDNLDFGGAQKMQVMLARVLPSRGVKLTVLSLDGEIDHTTTANDLRSLGVRLVFFPANRLLHLGRIWRIRNFMHQKKVDLVHSHLTYANIIGLISAKLAGKPTFASLRNVTIDRHPLRGPLETWLLRHWASRIMAVGHATAEAHKTRLQGQSIVPVPNAISPLTPLAETKRRALRTELSGDPTRPILISVGRLTQQKGYPDLLNALASVRQHHPRATLIIVGAGEMHPTLATQIQTMDLENQAILLGPRNDVPDLLRASDLFVSASHWEGLPVAVLEAMAAGLPIVATNVSDVPRVVVTGTGLVVPAQNPAKLAEAIVAMLNNSELRHTCGTQAQAQIATHHSPEVWADQIMSIYDSILGRETRPIPQEVA